MNKNTEERERDKKTKKKGLNKFDSIWRRNWLVHYEQKHVEEKSKPVRISTQISFILQMRNEQMYK